MEPIQGFCLRVVFGLTVVITDMPIFVGISLLILVLTYGKT